MDNRFDAVYYEPDVLNYELGKTLYQKYSYLPWYPIDSHNKIPEFTMTENKNFAKLKHHLILGIRKTHKYTENQKVSDWLVPFTSSGCRAMCLYCYLVCNYNKCSYLRVFVNREQMMEKLLKTDSKALTPETFEIGSNSDLVLENTVTDNLPWIIETFATRGKGQITFPTKFDMVDPLLNLDHRGKTIFRMSVNPSQIIKRVEIGTSSLDKRINAANKMAKAGYPVGLLIAPVILLPGWRSMYSEMFQILSDTLCSEIKQDGFLEIILMTYSYIHRAINSEAFPDAPQIYDSALMTGRGRGKYCYKNEIRFEAEEFLKQEINQKLKMKILYFS